MYDTIVAIATPPGRGGVGMVRVSGKSVATMAAAICGKPLAPRVAQHTRFLDAAKQIIDEVMDEFYAIVGALRNDYL